MFGFSALVYNAPILPSVVTAPYLLLSRKIWNCVLGYSSYYGNADPDFDEYQLFRAREDRWQDGRIFSQGAHLVQACAWHPRNRFRRSMAARSSAGDVYDLHNPRR